MRTFNSDSSIHRTVAITPTKSRSMDFEIVRRVCHDYTLVGLRAMVEARKETTTPFRFLYMSGSAAERDPTKTPRFMPQYSSMRVSNMHSTALGLGSELHWM